MTQHTPGPWTVPIKRVSHNQGFAIMAGGVRVADTIEDHSAVDAEANAHLISAAPDLLAACRAVVEWAEESGRMESNAKDEQLWQQILAAIAKAEPK